MELAISIQGELEARHLQARLNQIQGVSNDSDKNALVLELNKVEDLDKWRTIGGYEAWQPYAPPSELLIGPNGQQCRQKLVPYTSRGLVCVATWPTQTQLPGNSPSPVPTPPPVITPSPNQVEIQSTLEP